MERSEKKVDVLPEEFNFSVDDPFYLAPPTCEIMHYRSAAVFAAAIEFGFLMLASFAGWQFYHVNMSLNRWVLISVIVLFAFSVLTTLLLCYGIYKEMPSLLTLKLVFIRIESAILIALATISIVAMSVGIELTNALFGMFVKVAEMERDFGPLWPFNIGVVSFFGAALCIWMYALVRGAYDYLLDKEYFAGSSTIEMEKTLPTPQ